MDTQYSERGPLNPLLIITIVLSVAMVGLAIFGVWSFLNYNDQKNNVDQKIEAAIAEARRQQSEEDEAKFAEREKQPTKLFVGPEDLGRVEFHYPKTWSGYVDKSGGNGTYEAYFQPGVVPPLGSSTPYALRISIENKAYDQVLNDYQDEVKKGEVRSSAATVNGESGNRLEGKIDKDIDGVLLLFKVRDKTLKVYTQSRAFQADLDNIILPSLVFNR
jgi:hypothetical protein